jgi:hypothetical protein
LLAFFQPISIRFSIRFFTSAPWPSFLTGAVGAWSSPAVISWRGAPLLSFLGAVLPSCHLFSVRHNCSLAFKSCCYFLLISILLLIYSPILLFNLSVMNDHASRHLVTTALYCVGAPTVAALCECDCDCACVVWSDRKKKRVGACVGRRKVNVKKSSTLPPMIVPHSTNSPSSDDPKLFASSKQQIKNPIIATQTMVCIDTSVAVQWPANSTVAAYNSTFSDQLLTNTTFAANI